MNKKILAGLSGIVVAGAFWACGSGEINEPTFDDTVIMNLYPKDDAEAASSFMKEAFASAREACKIDVDPAGCEARINAADPDKSGDVVSSSSVTEEPGPGNQGQTPVVPVSSSSIVINNNVSSSSVGPIIVDPTSSGSEGTPSQTVTGLGSCAPATATIEKGGSTGWAFKLNATNPAGVSVTQLMKGNFTWEFEGASTPSEAATGKLNSTPVSYANSGSYGAKVTVAVGTSVETITCTPLQVNGDPITGCECAPAAPTHDFTSEPSAVWTVTGCKTASEPLTYNWDGTAGEASFSKTFTAATPAYAPKLKVGNSDNTVIDVTCAPVKVTEGAEYEIKASQDKVVFEAAGTYAVVVSGGSSLTACRISCNANGPLTATAKGKTFTGSYYLNFEGIDVSWCNTTLDLELSAAATCEASWN
ncbi:MAG: hypothetical protein MJZ26_05825 [Fibrobacter sp.]|nr:hypothetical protein [Fibrobacter sp.]